MTHIFFARSQKRAGLVLSLTLGLTLVAVAPSLAFAQDQDLRNYDGYCYAKSAQAQKNGTIIGAVLGGLIGSQASKHERGLGALGGAVIGGAIGSSAGKSSVRCYNGEYYSYQGSYYDPAPPPSGYAVVYYKSRPPQDSYSNVYYDRYHHTSPPPYGYNDAWKNDGSNPNGWRDQDGNWHDGRNHQSRHSHRGEGQ